MSRFQAKTNQQIDANLEYISKGLGIPENKKADLLREMANLSYWILCQVERGYVVQAKKGGDIQRLDNPLLHQILEKSRAKRNAEVEISLTEEEVRNLSTIFSDDSELPKPLKELLGKVLDKKRVVPNIVWNEG